MLLLNNFSSARFLSTRSITAFQQWNRHLKSVTPIVNQKYNFHLKCNTVREEDTWPTGLLKSALSTYQQQNHLRKFIHGQSALNFKQKEVEKNNKSSDDADDKSKKDDLDIDIVDKKLGIIARFKKMTKEYWYVLIPVHCFTSCFWFGGFYYASLCGVDIIGMLESWNFSEKLINPLRDSHLGHLAVAYFLYKIATPARYTVTVGGTTFAIKFLSQRGYLKPMPSKDKLVQMYKDKKEDIQQKVSDKKTEFTDKFRKNE